MDNNNFKGYSLFNDVEDFQLRAHNRGVTMANMFEEHVKGGAVPPHKAALILEYFKTIPLTERTSAMEVFEKVLRDRGLVSDKSKQ